MTMTLEQKLQEPFHPDDVEWRIAQAKKKHDGSIIAKVLAYITARAVMNRLDDVVGCGNWRDEYEDLKDGSGKIIGFRCGISIKIDGEWVTKWDAAECSDIEPIKGGHSDAEKRAAVKWGIGRYLYYIPNGWANIHDRGANWCSSQGIEFKWDPPALPDWALPKAQPPKQETKPVAKSAIDAIRLAAEATAKELAPKPTTKAAPSPAADESATHQAFAFAVNQLIEKSGLDVDVEDLFMVTLAQMDCEDLCYVQGGRTFGDLRKLRKCEDQGVFDALIAALKRQIAERSMSTEYKEFRAFAEDMVAKAKRDDVQIWPQGINSVMSWLLESKVFANREDLTKCRDVRKFATARGKVEQYQLENSREEITI